MTYKEAVELSLQVWKWLRDNPDKSKRSSPYWDLLQTCKCFCALCEYHEFYNPCVLYSANRCNYCILNLPKIGKCTCDNHPYTVWSASIYCDDIDCEKEANKIVDVLQKEYDEIINEEKTTKRLDDSD